MQPILCGDTAENLTDTEPQSYQVVPVETENQNNKGTEPITHFKGTSTAVRRLFGEDSEGLFYLFSKPSQCGKLFAGQREALSGLEQTINLEEIPARISPGTNNWQELATSISFDFEYLNSNYRTDYYRLGRLGILTGFRYIPEKVKERSSSDRDKTIWIHFPETSKPQLLNALDCSLQASRTLYPSQVTEELIQRLDELKLFIKGRPFPSIDIQDAIERFLSQDGAVLIIAEQAIQQLGAEEKFRKVFESEGLPITHPEFQNPDDEVPQINLVDGYSEFLTSDLLARRASRAMKGKRYLKELTVQRYGLYGSSSNYVYYKSNLQSDVDTMQNNRVSFRREPGQAPPRKQWEVVEEQFVAAYQKIGLPLPTIDKYLGEEFAWLFYGNPDDQAKRNLILVYELISESVNAIQTQIAKIDPDIRLKLAVVAETLTALQDENLMGTITPFKNEYFVHLIEVLREHSEDVEEIKPITLGITAGIAQVFVGANGGGKTKLVGNLLEKLVSVLRIPADRIIAPPSIATLAVADSTSEGEDKTLASFWGRGQGKSSFVTEIIALVERLSIVKSYTSEEPLLVMGDEINRRTDQLNATALAAAELILLWKRRHFSIFTSHSVWLPQKVGPLFNRLGINVDWNTMVDFVPTSIDSGNIVSSRAYQETARFVGNKLRLFIDDEFRCRGKLPPTIEGQVLEATTSEKLPLNENEPEIEFLRQIGWVTPDAYSGNKIVGLPEYLFGLRFEKNPDYLRLKCGMGPNTNSTLFQTLLNSNWERISEIPSLLSYIRTNRQRLDPLLNSTGELVQNYERLRDISRADITYRERSIKSFFIERWPEFRSSVTRLNEFSTEDIQLLLPEHSADEIKSLIDGIYALQIPETPTDIEIEKLSKLLAPFVRSGIIACSLEAVSINSQASIFCDVEKPEQDNQDTLSLEIEDGYGFGLMDIIEDRKSRNEFRTNLAIKQGTVYQEEEVPELVTNSVELNTHIGLTGPQGSGKTEALFAIAECCMTAELWGVSTAKRMIVDREKMRLIPLISVPANKANGARPLSSFELEVSNRIRFIEEYVENLPEGVAPILLMDEPLSTTGTSEASPIIGGLLEYIKSKGGRVVFATHSHESVWDYEKAHPGELTSMQVGMFNTENRYKLSNGHGESMGLEVAEIHGIPISIAKIARAIRNYLLETRDMEEIPEDILLKYQTEIQMLVEDV